MNAIRLLTLFFFCSVLSAQAPTPLARGNTPGELHHHLVLENSYVRVYNVIVPPHDATLLHRHDEDYMYVAIGPADIVNAVLDKPEVHAQLKDGEIHFVRGGFSHVARNLSGAPFHNVTIAFLRPQGAVRNQCEQVVPGPLGSCSTMTVVSVRGPSKITYEIAPWFESDGVIVDLTTFAPGTQDEDTRPASEFNRLLVALDQGEFEVSSSGMAPTKLHGSDILWLPAGSTQTITNRAQGQSRFLLIYFKDSAATKEK